MLTGGGWRVGVEVVRFRSIELFGPTSEVSASAVSVLVVEIVSTRHFAPAGRFAPKTIIKNEE